MRKVTLLIVLALLAVTGAFGRELKPRMVFEKYLFAEGVNPHARYLDRLMVKFYDEDMIRLRNGALVSTNGRNGLAATRAFLARHPELKPEGIITSVGESDYADMIARAEELSGKDLVDLFSFYRFRLDGPAANPKQLLAEILAAPEVEIAYYECIPYQSLCTDVGQTTPNYRPNQTFHDPAPLGVDLDYAWSTFGEDLTDGVSTNRTAVIEYETDITPTHEDYTTLVLATPEHSADTLGYHGGSVAGIVGACEENGVGVVGFTADHQLRYYDITALASVADVYTRVNAELSAGDYTTGSWAFFADPMPAGQTCPCNPGQNGHVPAEYDPSVKTAIDNGIAAGIHYLESAGNGCTNLDDATFGNTFRWSTDTGAMIVGAIESTGAHNASCFTGYGERVTLNAWGDGIVTTGKGTLFTGNGRREYYNASFGGTSGAGPIVAGCGGVLNNVYRSLNGGANISPTTLRSILAQNGTAPGTTPGNIGVMPNLFAIMSPNLNPDFRVNWTSCIVPRNSPDATGASCLVPTNLVSDPDTTFWNMSIENTSLFGSAEPAYWRGYIDDHHIAGSLIDVLSPQGRTYSTNAAFTVGFGIRGGRHTTRVTCDPLYEVTEFTETDNSYTRQYVWDPRPLTAETPLQFTRPTTRWVTDQPGSYYNCEGYQLNNGFSGWWDLFAVMSRTSDGDYDARIYSESITSTNGFDDYEQWSGMTGAMDFVGRNKNVSNGTVLASVINWDGADDDYRVEGETTQYLGIPQYGPYDFGGYTIGATELMDAVEFYADTVGSSYTVTADITSGLADIVISVFSPADTFFSTTDRDFAANLAGAGGDETLCFTASMTGYYLIVVHKYGSSDWDQTATFNLLLGKSVSDLTHSLNSGWSHEIVIRQQSGLGIPAVLPALLSGNTSTNYFNAGYTNIGCENSPVGINNRFFVDGETMYTSPSWIATTPGIQTYWVDRGPVFIFGGRHQVTDSIDIYDEAAEWIETNNRHDEQFVWSPYVMTNVTAYSSGSPAPNWRLGDGGPVYSAWNQDGWRFIGTSRWCGVAMCPVDSADDYVMGLYSPSTGSENGFVSRLVLDSPGSGLLSFTVENGNLNGTASFDVGYTNNWSLAVTPSVNSYRAFQCNSRGDLTMNAVAGPYTLGSSQLMHVYDLNLTAGTTTRIILDNQGAVDLGLAIFDATDSYGSRSQNGTVTNATGDAGDETVNFTASSTGRHGIVVFKQGYTDLGSCTYRLIVGQRTPAIPQNLVIQVIDASTNPIQMRAHWDSVLTDNAGAAMNVDYYRLYYTMDDTNDFPTGWTMLTTTTQATLSFSVATTVTYLRMLVLAVDDDGFLLAHPVDPAAAVPVITGSSADPPAGYPVRVITK